MSKRKIVYIAVAELKDAGYQLLPAWPEAEMAGLVAEVKASGEVREPLQVDEHKNILDGHHRWHAAKLAGILEVPCIVREGLSDLEKLKIVYGQLYHRMIDRWALKNMAEKLLLSQHSRTNTCLALMLPVSDKTFAEIRQQLIAAGKVPDHDTLVGLDGKEYPADRPRSKASAPTTAVVPNAAVAAVPLVASVAAGAAQPAATQVNAAPKPGKPVQTTAIPRQREEVLADIRAVSGTLCRGNNAVRIKGSQSNVLGALLDGMGFRHYPDRQETHIGTATVMRHFDEAAVREALGAGEAVLILPQAKPELEEEEPDERPAFLEHLAAK